MARQKLKHLNVVTEGKFDTMIPPSFELFEIVLKERDYQITNEKTQELISSDKNFEILIDAQKVSKSFISELSNELQVAFGLKFAPFNIHTKTYNFYTSRYTGDLDNKKQLLTNIFNCLEEFQKDYMEKIKNNIPIFEKAKEEIKDFTTPEFDFKFSNEFDTFVVIAKSFIGPDSYRKLASCSSLTGKVATNEKIKELFANPKYEKKSFFILNKDDYVAVNDYIRGLKQEKDSFIIEQSKLFDSNAQMYKDLQYNTPNVFDYKIELDEERKCFIFFCKGYEVSNWEGRSSPRNLLQNWALNLILSSPISQMKPDDYLVEYELSAPSFVKEKLNYQKDSSKKEKIYWVPFEEVDKIKRIHENFKKEELFWSRPQFDVRKQTQCFIQSNNSADLRKHPAIYLDSKGQAYFTFGYREVNSKKIQGTVINLKGIKINQEEFEYFTEKHLFAQEIKNNTKFLNVQLWAGHETLTNLQQTEQAYEDILMAYRLNNLKKSAPSRKVKI